MDQKEGVLTYKCSASGQPVRTTIRTNKQTLNGLHAYKISVWCPHCCGPHQIYGKDASLYFSMIVVAT